MQDTEPKRKHGTCMKVFVGTLIVFISLLFITAIGEACGLETEPDTRQQWDPKYCFQGIACDEDWMPVDCPACTPTSHWKH